MTDSRKIAIYLRLSIEDDALDGKASTEQRESNSISNQRKMLLDYIRNDAELMGRFFRYEYGQTGAAGDVKTGKAE